jgi:regulator of sigma E protease
MLTTITFILVISVLIIIHELGHFLAAKLMKIKIEEFGLGIPPRLFTLWDDGETKYTLNALPIGGFVKLYGEDESNGDPNNNQSKGTPDKEHSFFYKSKLSRAFVLTAGVIMNYLLAVILLMIVIIQLGDASVITQLKIESVAPQSPAEIVGLQSNDLVTGYKLAEGTGDYIEFKATKDFSEFIKSANGNPVELLVRRSDANGNLRDEKIVVTPRVNPPAGEGALGVVISEFSEVKYDKVPLYRAPILAVQQSVDLTKSMVEGLGRMAGDLFQKGEVPQDVAGPLGIAKITGEVVQRGFYQLLQFMALISLNLAVINILPFPALDGGRLLFVILEFILGKRVSPRVEQISHSVGMVVLLLLVAVITFYDFVRFF